MAALVCRRRTLLRWVSLTHRLAFASNKLCRLSLALEPTSKLRCIKKNWPEDDYETAENTLQKAISNLATPS